MEAEKNEKKNKQTHYEKSGIGSHAVTRMSFPHDFSGNPAP
jgi:hypothetical protein